MTSSKKAAKPSSSFKKASPFTNNPGQRQGRDDTGYEPQTQQAKDWQNKNKGKKAGKAVKDITKEWEQDQSLDNNGGYGEGATVSTPGGAKATTGSARARGQMINEPMKNEGESSAEAASRLDNNAKTGADAAVKTAGKSKEEIRAMSDQVGEDKKAEERMEAEAERKKWIEDAVAEERKKAAMEKRQFDPKEAEERFAKEYDEQKEKEAQNAANEGLDEMEQKRRNKVRDEKFRELMEGGMDRKTALDRANKMADKQMAEEKRQREIEERNTPEARAKRAERYQGLLNGVKAFTNTLGKAAEGINKGLDLMGTMLHGMLNPSPLGLSEAQTMVATTADAFGLADELVSSIVKKGEEAIGKRITNNMAASMGDIINKNFGGKNIDDMTPEELDVFTEQLSAAWAPFINRLEVIGSKNPAGAALAKKFMDTFNSISQTAKGNKQEATINKKRYQQQIRDTQNYMKEYTKDVEDQVIANNRARYQKIANPTLPDGSPNPNYSEKDKIMWDLANLMYGKEANNTTGPNGEDVRKFGWLLDPKLMYYDKLNDRYVPTPQMAKRLLTQIEHIKTTSPDVYQNNKDEYDELAKEMAGTIAAVKDETQTEEGLAKYDYHMAGAQTPLETIRAQMTLTDRKALKQMLDSGENIGDRIPEKVLTELGKAAGKSVQYYYNLERSKAAQGQTLTQEEQNMYTIARNTQDFVYTVQTIRKMEAQIDKIDTVRDLSKEPIGTDELGRPIYPTRTFLPDEKARLKNILEEALTRAAASTDLEMSDIANGVADRRHFLRVGDDLFETAVAVQNELKDSADFPNIIGDPSRAYMNRVGGMDYIRAMNNNTNDIYSIIDRLGIVTKGMSDTVDKISGDISNNMPVLMNDLASVNSIISNTAQFIENGLADKVADSIEAKKFVGKFVNAMDNVIKKRLDELDFSGVPPEVAQNVKDILTAQQDVLKEIQNGNPAAIEQLTKIQTSIENLGVKMEQASQAQITDRGAQADKIVDAMGQPAAKPAKRSPPSWYDPNDLSALAQWVNKGHSGSPMPKDWPTGDYWNRYSELMSLIDNVPDSDRSKGALMDIARKAYIRGVFGHITSVPGKVRKYTQMPETNSDGGTLVPQINVDHAINGVMYDNKGQKIQILDADGNATDLTEKDWDDFMDGLFKIQGGLSDVPTSALQMDSRKDRPSKEDHQRFMGTLLGLIRAYAR